MSYLVLARKYRPRDFEALVGQEHVVQALVNALTRQRLHHAYLFTGTRGVGKTTVSRILAKSLNCTGAHGQGDITAKPCGVCNACRDIDSGRFVDYVELDAASNRGVEEISQLLGQAVYKPVLGRFKVYMIDEVHMLSNTAFNAMLKTLEEPPDYLKFVLATTDPQKVPPTVLSRCLQFNLRPMAPQTVQQHLASVLTAEQIEAEPGALRLLARAARGSMRDALSLTDQAIAYGDGALSEAGVRQMLGAVDRSHAVRLVEALAAGNGSAVISTVDELRSLGLSAAGTLEEMASLLQQMAVLQAVPAAADESDPDTPAALRLAGLLAADETQLIYSIVLHGRAELSLAPDEYSGMVMVLLRVLAFRTEGAAVEASPEGFSAANPPVCPKPVATGSVAITAKREATRPTTMAAAPNIRVTVSDSVLRERDPSYAPPVAEISKGMQLGARKPIDQCAANLALQGGVKSVDTEGVLPLYTGRVERPTAGRAGSNACGDTSSAVRRSAQEPTEATVREVTHAGAVGIPFLSAQAVAEGQGGGGCQLPVAPSVTPAGDPGGLGDRWAQVVAQLTEAGRIGGLARELALQAQCVAVQEQDEVQVWRLRLDRETLRAPALRDKLQAALADLMQRTVRLELEAGAATDSPAQRIAAESARRQAQAEQIIHNDPLVQTLMQQFKTARIVPGSVKPH